VYIIIKVYAFLKFNYFYFVTNIKSIIFLFIKKVYNMLKYDESCRYMC
jgi:hypothetical protein